MHNAASRKDRESGLKEVRAFTGKQKPWDSYSPDGLGLTAETDHEGNMPVHLAMHQGNWWIAHYLLAKHPRYKDPPSAQDVER